jgi:hypothetical protein
MEFQLKGWPAVIAIAAIVIGFIGYQFYLYDDLESNPEVRENLAMNLSHEIAGDIMADAEAVRSAMKSGEMEKAEAIGKGILERRVTIGDLAMKGRGENIVVKADYTVHGPDGDVSKTGYFNYSHSPITGFRYRRETTVLSWYMTFF